MSTRATIVDEIRARLSAPVAEAQEVTSLLDRLAQSNPDARLRAVQERLRRLGVSMNELAAWVAGRAGALRGEGPAAADGAHGLVGRVIETMLATDPRDMERTCTPLVEALVAATGAERGCIVQWGPDAVARLLAQRGFDAQRLDAPDFRPSNSLIRRVVQDGRLLWEDHAAEKPEWAHARSVVAQGIKSVLIAPLGQAGQTFGAIYLENSFERSAFGEGHRDLVQHVAGCASRLLIEAGLLPAAVDGPGTVALLPETAIIGRSVAIRQVIQQIARIARSHEPVLIQGESGTGKDLVAREIHGQSDRAGGAYEALSCANLTPALFDSEVFGHVKGAFTGATSTRAGRAELADKGTLFLDEIGELPLENQARFLRFLETRSYRPVGDTRDRTTDVRIVTATNRNLEAEVAAGRFREDLFYRINVLRIDVPPLRKRVEDIPLLIDHFLASARKSQPGEPAITIDREARACLAGHPFLGNVRELKNLVMRLVVMCGPQITRAGLEQVLRPRLHVVPLPLAPPRVMVEPRDTGLGQLRELRAAFDAARDSETRRILSAALEAGATVAEIARDSQINRTQLYGMIERLGIDLPSPERRGR